MDTRTAGYQRWNKLAFIHWRVSASALQSMIPTELTVEQFDGSAWLGLIPFSMEAVRPWWSPPMPGISWFLETNVRTYVVDQQGARGVWFFSLDANKQIAVTLAQTIWHLPYKMASLSMCDSLQDRSATLPRQLQYAGRRTDQPTAEYNVSIKLDPKAVARSAAPDSLDHFLVERYTLFAQRRSGQIMSGQVHHAPYQIINVERCIVEQSLTAAMGCPIDSARPPDHVVYSEGVSVRVSPLKPPQRL